MTTRRIAGFNQRATRAQKWRSQRWATGAILLGVSASLSLANVADGQIVNFNIAPQLVESALLQFSHQAGVQVMAGSSAVAGQTTGGVKGQLSVASALGQLLQHTGLTYEATGSTVTVIRVAALTKAGQGGSQAEGKPEATRKLEKEPLPAARSSDEQPVGYRPEEVIVTAQKRAENIRDVPISVSAVTADEIDRRALFNAADFLSGIPSVNQIDGGPFSSAIVIRGIETSTTSQNFNSGTTTATYFGETPTTNSAGMAGNSNVDIKLVDIERVEVLRGPQGTAFGSSSLGGAVRTIPIGPKLDRFEGKVLAGYSETSGTGGDNHNVQGVVNVPIVREKFAIRAVAYKYEDSGFYRNRAGSDPAFQRNIVERFQVPANFAIDQDQVGAYSVVGGRFAALLEPVEGLRISVGYLKQKSETDGVAMANSGKFEQSFLQVAPQQVRRGQTGGVYDTDLELANATVEYGLSWASILGTYSYTESHSVGAFPFAYVGQANASISDADSRHRENVAELRLVSKLDGPLNFLLGLYQEELEDLPAYDFFQHYYWVGSPATNIYAPGGSSLVGTLYDHRTSKQKAAYGEVSWEIVDRLTLTGGIRAYDYDRDRRYVTSGPFIGSANATLNAGASGTSERANLSYKPNEDWLVYAGYSEGFRLGRPQIPLPSVCDRDGDGLIDGTSVTRESTGTLNSDHVKNYEIGSKASFLDRRLSVDGAVFRMDWSGFPTTLIAPAPPTGCGINYTINAGRARSNGLEIQVALQLNPNLRIDAGGAWYDPQLLENVPAAGLKKGNRLAGAPRMNGNLGVDYGFQIFGHDASIAANSIYVGSFYGNILESPLTKAGGYVKVDTSLRIAFSHLSVDLFVHNLTNEDAFVFRRVGANTIYFGNRLRPRTVGINLSSSF